VRRRWLSDAQALPTLPLLFAATAVAIVTSVVVPLVLCQATKAQLQEGRRAHQVSQARLVTQQVLATAQEGDCH
jgi:uncharacterized membrane protein